MVKLRLAARLKHRKMMPYGLAQATTLSLPTVYRLGRPDGAFIQLETYTADRTCGALGCKAADLIVRVTEMAAK